MYLADILPINESITAENIASLIEIEHGLERHDIDKVLSMLSNPSLGIMYNFVYSPQSKSFIYTKPAYIDGGNQPTMNDIHYGVQEFEKFVDFNRKIDNENVYVHDLVVFLNSLFDVKVNLTPIFNELQRLNKITVNGDDLTLH